MVCQWGMSEKLGSILYDSSSQEVFLGHSVAQSKNISEETANLIDKEVKDLVNEATERCTKILKDKINDLHTLAKGLLDYETLTYDEVKDLLNGIAPKRDDFDDSPTTSSMPPKTSVPKSGDTTAPQTN